MRGRFALPQVRLKASVYVYLAGMVLLLPVKWLFAGIFSAALHEAFHIAAIRLTRRKVLGITVSASGTEICTAALLPREELLCALAGPASCVIGLLLARWFPRLAVCSVLHSLYNLLPVYPLDGGRALLCAAEIALPQPFGDVLCRYIEAVCLIGIGAAAVYGCVILRLGIFPILLAAFLIARAQGGKKPCKDGKLRVQ